jgi:hypothetical protein
MQAQHREAIGERPQDRQEIVLHAPAGADHQHAARRTFGHDLSL